MSFKELSFNKDAALQHITLLSQEKLKKYFFVTGIFQAFCEASLITAILQNSFQRRIYNPVEHLR